MVRRVGIAAQLCFQRYCALVGAFGAEIPELSQRELDVVRWIGEGKSNAVIAEILEISKHSVDSYVQRIFAKLDVSDRTAAAIKAVALGLIAPGRHSKRTYRARWVP
jgi:DNA-binding CsgD family transcriptional regulator